ncbi:hypothetical protein Glove_557g71 [Diversispora epigaea]|uniref:Protein kinase domain-containing protein n=1 Tax=Diversispora epigaea TaxID=1348612 RepID=A0A397GJG2_9GLOM|nr:hypothetical protein Glove_557g71 [Diversispora epigaea]
MQGLSACVFLTQEGKKKTIGRCYSCTKGHFIPEFKTWSNGNANIDKILQESQINDIHNKLQWIPNDNFQNIEHIADGLGISLNSFKFALKEIKDSGYAAEFLNIKIVNNNEFIASYYGISKNPSHFSSGLRTLHEKKFRIDSSSCELENDLILNSNNKNDKIYGSIPYIPPEVFRENEFTREGDIYSFDRIMHEMVTAQRPFADQAHDTYLMIDICNGVRHSDDPFERPSNYELTNLFRDLSYNTMDSNVARQLKIADENQKSTSKAQKQELF